MTKIMIVDDELIVRKCLRTTIDWEKYNCSVVAEASDCREALDIYKKTHPDIVITDIVMPSSNGLDLIAEIRAISSETEFIILSGYDRFEYAQTAMIHTVSAYLLKPVENEVIISEVAKLQKKIDLRRRAYRSIPEITTVNRNDFLLNLINSDGIDSAFIDTLCKRYSISPPSDRYSVAIFHIDDAGKAYDSKQAFLQLRETLNYCISMCKDHVLYTSCNNKIVLLSIYASHSSDICRLIKQIQTRYKENYDYNITAGISGVFKNLAIFKRAYQQAIYALEQRASFGAGSIIAYTDISSSPDNAVIILHQDKVNEIISLISDKKIEKAVSILNDYFNNVLSLKRVNIAMVRNSILELVILLIHTMVKNSNTMHVVFGRDFLPSVELQSMESILEIKIWTVSILEKISECQDLIMPERYSPALSKAIMYIRANYTQKIKLDDIANEIFVSSRSLSRMFLAETGKSCANYITEYRIKIALNLLTTTSYKICDIATLVGYSDVKHFYKIFKKVTGHTPKFYRKGTEDTN